MTTDWVKLELDVSAFDVGRFAPVVDRVRASGVDLSTLDEIGTSEVELRRMYDLNAECSADIPGRGPFYTWEEYRRVRIEVDSFDPRGVVIARRGTGSATEWVGMAGTTAQPSADCLFNSMTGVVRAERRRGLAIAMKVHNTEFAGVVGRNIVRTVHHPGNVAMIDLNRRLGYVDATWPHPP